MSDPLSVSASIVSVVGFAIQSAQFLARTIDAIKEVPASLKSIRLDLDAVTPVLQQLENAVKNANAKSFPYDQLAPGVQNCDRACTAFRQKLENWTRHSNSKSGAMADKWKIGIFGQERIQTLKAQLGECKATLVVALSTATFITISKAEEDHSDKVLLLQSREQSLQLKLAKAAAERSAIESKLQQIINIPEASSSDGLAEKEELLEELQHQMCSSQLFSDTCEEAISQLAYERTGHRIHGTKAKDNSSALAGFFNASSMADKTSLDISNTWAENSSIANAGIFDNYDFKGTQSNKP